MAGAPVVPDPTQNAIGNLEVATQNAPEMQSAPGAAIDVATAGGDVAGSAQAVSAAGNRQARAAAATNVNKAAGGGLLGAFGAIGHDIVHAGEDLVGDTIKAVNMPLQAVQHEWRYLHDVEARHGLLAALGEGLVIVGAAAAGAVLTGGVADVGEAGLLAGAAEAGGAEAGAAEGAATVAGAGEAGAATEGQAGRTLLQQGVHIAGKALNIAAPARALIPGEAAGMGMAQVLYRDSWNRTGNSQYRDPHTGGLVNFGNDVAGWIGLKGAAKTAMSGASNGIFDLMLDPVASAGKAVGEARSTGKLVVGGRFMQQRQFSRAFTAENLERLAADKDSIQGQAFNRWLDWAAKANSGDIIAFDRRLESLVPDATNAEGQVVAKGLGNASSADEVADVLRRHLTDSELTSTSTLPSMSLSRLGMTKIRDYVNNAKVTYLHPLMGGIRHPTALLGNVGKLTTRVPGTSFDRASNTFTNTTVNLTSLRGLSSLRDWYELGLGRAQANSITHLIANSDVATRHIIHRNASLMTLLGHAGLDFGAPDVRDANWFSENIDDALNHINDPKFREHVQRRIDSLMAPTAPDASGQYAGTLTGEPVRPFIDPDTGKEHAGAVLLSQIGDVPLPSYSEVHRIAQSLHGGMMFTGKMDDFLMKHVTDPIFKRWILMSLGYAEHISAAEIIPNTFRLGFTTMAKASYYTALAHLGIRSEADADELRGMTKVAYELLSDKRGTGPLLSALKGFQAAKHSTVAGLHALAPKSQAEMDKVMSWIKVTDGHLVTPGLSPHGGIIDSHGDDMVGKATGAFRGLMERTKFIRGDNYTLYGPADQEHLRAWRVWTNLQAKDGISRAAAKAMRDAYARGATNDEAYTAAQEAAHAALKGTPRTTLDDYMGSRLKRVGDPPSMTPLESWSHVIAENLAAATHSGADDHAPNMTLLHNVAEGRPTFKGVFHGIPIDERPRGVPGRELVPSGASAWARLSSIGYQRVLNPVVNVLSRQPLAFAEFSKRMDTYQHLVDQGLMLPEEVVIKAASEATIDAIRYVHNIQDRTQLDQLLRNWVPFFFAQEQAYRRMGRLLVEDPGAFRRYMLAIQSTHNIVAQTQDGQGNRYFAFPGAGFLDHLTVGMFGMLGMPTASINPTGFGGTLSAANVVFPGANGVRPDISPVVTLAAQQVYHFFDEFGMKYENFQPIANVAKGAIFDAAGAQNMSQSIVQQLVPNTTLYRAIETASGNDTSFTSAFLMTLQNLAYRQNVAMREWYAGGQKGPMPEIIPPPNADPGQLQAFLARVKNQTRVVFGMRAVLGALSPVSADVMVDDFGLNAKLQADIKSTGSVSLGFQKFLHDNPDATPYVVSKSETATGAKLPDTQAALDWVTQNQKLLSQYQFGGMWLMPRLTDTKYSAQAYLEEIANGLRARRTPAEFLNALYAENGDQIYYNALASHEAALHGGADPSQEYARWDSYMQMLQAQQPIWWSQFNSGQRQSDAQRSINELSAIYASNAQPNTPQSQDVGELLAAYQSTEQQYMQAGTQTNYSAAQRVIRDQWIAYCNQLAQQKPNLQSIISSVFRNALTYTNIT